MTSPPSPIQRTWSDIPEVSVVMSVYNGGAALHETIESVLAQESVTLEFVIVDDGSTDETPTILAETAVHDARVRVIRQDNAGLTRALITGCEAARAPLIARQDAGDRSLPGRLAAQVARFTVEPDLVMLASGARFRGPGNELLDEILKTDADIVLGLASLELVGIGGPPHHGGVMFRREAYESVGGYRATFSVAQDLDLWLRLYEAGRCGCIPTVCYEATLTPGAISSKRRAEQLATTETILKCARARRYGADEQPLLRAFEIRGFSQPASSNISKRRADARFHYHIATRLEPTDVAAARHYLCLALRRFPLHIPAALRLITIGLRK